jgi:hypothetical protein
VHRISRQYSRQAEDIAARVPRHRAALSAACGARKPLRRAPMPPRTSFPARPCRAENRSCRTSRSACRFACDQSRHRSNRPAPIAHKSDNTREARPHPACAATACSQIVRIFLRRPDAGDQKSSGHIDMPPVISERACEREAAASPIKGQWNECYWRFYTGRAGAGINQAELAPVRNRASSLRVTGCPMHRIPLLSRSPDTITAPAPRREARAEPRQGTAAASAAAM